MNFAKFLRTAFHKEHLWWLLVSTLKQLDFLATGFFNEKKLSRDNINNSWSGNSHESLPFLCWYSLSHFHWSLSNSCAEVFFQKDALKIFCKIHRETPVPESLFWRPATILKKGTLAYVFSCEFYEIFNSSFFHRTPPVATLKEQVLWHLLEVQKEIPSGELNVQS